jgi:hypothetical protein
MRKRTRETSEGDAHLTIMKQILICSVFYGAVVGGLLVLADTSNNADRDRAREDDRLRTRVSSGKPLTAKKPGALGIGLFGTTLSWANTFNELVIDVR